MLQVSISKLIYRLARVSDRSLAGESIVLSGEYEAFNWRTTLAWRNGDPSTAELDKKPRFWVQAGWLF